MKFIGLIVSAAFIVYGYLVHMHNQKRWDGEFEKYLEIVTLYGGILAFIILLFFIIKESVEEHRLNRQ